MKTISRIIVLALIVVLTGAPAAKIVRAQDGGQVVSVQTYELSAGRANTGGYLSPDGTRLAVLTVEAVCIYSTAGTLERCTLLAPDLKGVDPDDARWSPDGRYLVMAQNFLRYLIDSDIWLLDVTTGVLSNLTEDGITKFDLIGKTDSASDILPVWSSDSTRLLFLRDSQQGGEIVPPALCTITVEEERAGAPDCAVSLSVFAEEPLSVIALDWDDAHGRIAMVVSGNADELNGVWIANEDGTDAQQIIAASLREFPALGLTFSPDGGSLLVFALPGNGQPDPKLSPARIVRLVDPSLELIDPERYVYSAAWAPDGSSLAYVVIDRTAPETTGLYLTVEAGQPGTLVLPGTYLPPTPRHSQLLIWTAAGTILLAQSELEFTLAAVQLGAP